MPEDSTASPEALSEPSMLTLAEALAMKPPRGDPASFPNWLSTEVLPTLGMLPSRVVYVLQFAGRFRWRRTPRPGSVSVGEGVVEPRIEGRFARRVDDISSSIGSWRKEGEMLVSWLESSRDAKFSQFLTECSGRHLSNTRF
jgi:hypothetical protein